MAQFTVGDLLAGLQEVHIYRDADDENDGFKHSRHTLAPYWAGYKLGHYGKNKAPVGSGTHKDVCGAVHGGWLNGEDAAPLRRQAFADGGYTF